MDGINIRQDLLQVVGAVVDGHGSGIPVNGEPAFCDAIRDAAANRTAMQ